MSVCVVWVGVTLCFEMLVLYNIGNFSADVAKPDDIRLCRYWKEREVLLDLEKLLGYISLNCREY